MKLHRGECVPSTRQRAAIEAEAFGRFERHIDFRAMANDLRALRDDRDLLSDLLWRAWAGLPVDVRADAEALIGPPPVHGVTPIGVTLTGKFVEMAAGG